MMPSELGLPFVLLLQTFIGVSILGACAFRSTRTITLLLSLFAGMFVHSMLFFACDMLGIPLTATSMFMSAIAGVLLTLPLWKTTSNLVEHLRAPSKSTLRLYDVPVIGLSGYVFYMILWASWYWPVTPFDAMAGIDLVAKYVVKDHTIVNSVFTHPSLQGQLSNQPFYAPFAMLMQSIMKLIGFTHNQVWIGIVSVAFSIFIWAALRQLVHPFIAAILYLLYLLTPEMFGYTYLLQTDYLNAVYMTIGVYALWQGADKRNTAMMFASIVFFAAGCWSRTETILLVAIGLASTLPYLWKVLGARQALRFTGVAAMLCLAVFALWHVVFFNAYLPVRPQTADQLVGFDPARFIEVAASTWTAVISRIDYWGIIVWLFVVVGTVNAVLYRRIASSVLLLWIGAILLGLWLSGTLFSAAVVEQTLRRGMFKLIPLLVFAIAATEVVTSVSNRLSSWELKRSS
jgi:hypothetical protein